MKKLPALRRVGGLMVTYGLFVASAEGRKGKE